MLGLLPSAGVRVIGVDCATQPKSVGLALCVTGSGRPRIEHVAVERSWADIDRRVAAWLGPDTLIAVDAPLGWPATLSDALSSHRAGVHLPLHANQLFRRRTDDAVAAALGKRPLDVGADRIARTAHAALALLARLREARRLEIPLAWSPGELSGVAAIEVYPAGTLSSRDLPRAGYKGDGSEAASVRRALVSAVAGEIAFDDRVSLAMLESDHVLDAVLCCLAGCDFLREDVMMPDDAPLAEREGWIWVRARAHCG